MQNHLLATNWMLLRCWSVVLESTEWRLCMQIIEFLPDASYKASKVNLKDAQLDPRDMSLFVQRHGFANQRATLAPRRGAILFRTEIARAIIMKEKALIFPARSVSNYSNIILLQTSPDLYTSCLLHWQSTLFKVIMSQTNLCTGSKQVMHLFNSMQIQSWSFCTPSCKCHGTPCNEMIGMALSGMTTGP